MLEENQKEKSREAANRSDCVGQRGIDSMQNATYQVIGEYIRQLRRQQSLTQTELGGERFSKSYVSAVERDKIVPSYEALHFFAEQLGQQFDYFEKMLAQNESVRSKIALVDPQQYRSDEEDVQEKVLPLLDILLEGTELHTGPFFNEFSTIAPEIAATLPAPVQGRYSFLVGLLAQQKGDLSAALHAFEHALILAPTKYRPAILDALGINYYLAHAYYVALEYHKRALRLLQEGTEVEEEGEVSEENVYNTIPALLLKIEFHCGNDYQAIGAHKQAREHYERARTHLRAAHDMRTAAQLYLKLGYSTYADTYHSTATNPTTRCAAEEVEREFQRAISFLVQSRTLYQVSSDSLGEARARLSQTMVLLDFSTRRRQLAQEKERTTGTLPPMNCASLLDEAEEQCRQILMGWQPQVSPPTVEMEIFLYSALSYLIRVYAQRAVIAQLGGYMDTAARERSVAVHLCEQALNTLGDQEFPWLLIQDVASLQENALSYQSQALPRLPKTSSQDNPSLRHAISRFMVYFAAGEVAETLGRAATQPAYAYDCYDRADQCLQATVSTARLVIPAEEHDFTYLIRCYQRSVDILEERKLVAPEAAEKTNSVLQTLLKDALYSLHRSVL